MTQVISEMEIMTLQDVKRHIQIGGWLSKKSVKAVDGVSLVIRRGETLGLVGESGCGKSTLGRILAQLQAPTSGQVNFLGKNLTALTARKLRHFRKEIQFILQDPFASLNPRMRIGEIIEEPLRNFQMGSASEIASRRQEIMEICGLPTAFCDRFPHQLSGGQRQRVGIARALILEPKLVIADEPISALDVSIQAQILNLFVDLRRRLNLTLIFISHDLAAVRYISDRIAVMYLGKLVELGPSIDICATPQHPYTAALLSASPIPNPKIERQRKCIPINGEMPSPISPPRGCRFHTRCPIARFPRCIEEEPLLNPTEVRGRSVACHFPGELSLPVSN